MSTGFRKFLELFGHRGRDMCCLAALCRHEPLKTRCKNFFLTKKFVKLGHCIQCAIDIYVESGWADSQLRVRKPKKIAKNKQLKFVDTLDLHFDIFQSCH